MRTLIKIAWRNIWRNKKRSLVIITAIALGLTGGNFISSAYLGLMNQTLEETIEKQLSHIQIHNPKFIEDREVHHRIENARYIVQDFEKHSDVQSVALRTAMDGMAASPHFTAGVSIVGVYPERELETTRFDELIVKGAYFEEKGRLPPVVIGEELAGKLQSDTGSRIVLTFQDKEGELTSASFRVEGIFRATATAFEMSTVFVEAEDIKSLVGDKEAVTEIAVRLHDRDRSDAVTEELKSSCPDLTVRNWKQIGPDLSFLMEYTKTSLLIIMAVILLGVAFGILNTILMSVLERTRELGMLMSVGMKRVRVTAMIVLETVMLSLTGGVFGLFFSFALVSILSHTGMDLSAIGGEALRDFGFSPVVYPELHGAFYLQVAVMIVLFAILASIYPARKAAGLQPAEAVRKE